MPVLRVLPLQRASQRSAKVNLAGIAGLRAGLQRTSQRGAEDGIALEAARLHRRGQQHAFISGQILRQRTVVHGAFLQPAQPIGDLFLFLPVRAAQQQVGRFSLGDGRHMGKAQIRIDDHIAQLARRAVGDFHVQAVFFHPGAAFELAPTGAPVLHAQMAGRPRAAAGIRHGGRFR